MIRHRLVVPFLGIVLGAASLGAQNSGTVEIKGFGQYTRMNGALAANSGGGSGVGLGVFLGSRWEIEGDGSFLDANTAAPRTPGTLSYSTFTARLVDNIPLTRNDDILIGVGPGVARSSGSSGFVTSGMIGIRHAFTSVVQLRVGGLLEYDQRPSGALLGYSPGSAPSQGFGYHANYGLRAGLSFMVGGHESARAVPVVAERRTPPPAAPQPAAPTRQPPAPKPVVRAVSATPSDRGNMDAATIRQPVHFDFDKSLIRAEDAALLDAKLPILRAKSGMQIRIEGNCDERGSATYNLALGMRRAAAAKAYLVDRGIDATRITIASYGNERPVDPAHDEVAWAKNRHDDFVIVVGAEPTRGE